MGELITGHFLPHGWPPDRPVPNAQYQRTLAAAKRAYSETLDRLAALVADQSVANMKAYLLAEKEWLRLNRIALEQAPERV